MSYARGNQGYVMLSSAQSAIGTKATPVYTGTIAAGEDLKLVKPGKQVLVDRIRHNVAPTVVQSGKIHTEGTLTYDLIPDEALGINLAMIAGSNNTVSGNASVGYTHTFNFWSGCNDFGSTGITIQKLVGGCTNAMLADFIGTFANTFELTVPEDGVCTYAVGYMGIKNAFAGSTLATPVYSSVSPFEGWMATLSVGSLIGSVAAIAIKSCKLNIENNLQLLMDHNASNQYPSAVVPQSRKVTLEFEVSQEDSLTLYNYFLNDTKNAVQLTLTHSALAGSSSGAYSIVFKLPVVTWLGQEPTIDSADVLKGTYSMEALYDSVTGYDVQAVVVNSQSGVYTV